MNIVRLIAVGDICLQTKNKTCPFDNVKGILESKDILFGNLETVLSNSNEKTEKAVVLSLPPKYVRYIKEAGFDILNLANNHILDLGIKGFIETLNVLRKNKLSFIGVNDKPGQNFLVINKKGIKFGFLGYTEGVYNLHQKGVWINKINLRDIKNDIEQIKPKCDFIIVSLHWGTENVFYPSYIQVELAHNLIDAGATVILGHHPHVLQGIEQYKHGLIAYSLGNFQFNPGKHKHSMILFLEFTRGHLESYYVVPVIIDDDFVPRPDNETGQETLNFIANISEPIIKGTINENWWLEQIATEYLSGNLRSWIIRIKKYGFKHFLQCVIWLISPFCLRCYLSVLRQRLKSFSKKP